MREKVLRIGEGERVALMYVYCGKGGENGPEKEKKSYLASEPQDKRSLRGKRSTVTKKETMRISKGERRRCRRRIPAGRRKLGVVSGYVVLLGLGGGAEKIRKKKKKKQQKKKKKKLTPSTGEKRRSSNKSGVGQIILSRKKNRGMIGCAKKRTVSISSES